MRIVGYDYRDPLIDSLDPTTDWGVPVDRVYQDWRGSQGQPDERPQWEQLVADCQRNPVQYVLIQRLEALGNSLKEVADRLNEVMGFGAEVRWVKSLAESGEDSPGLGEAAEALPQTHNATDGTSLGQALDPAKLQALQLMQIINHAPDYSSLEVLETWQRNHQSRKIRRGHARNRLQSVPPPGRAPYGYRRGKDRYILDRTTAPVVKEFFEHFILYGSLRGAVRHVTKKYNKRISVSTGQRWLGNPVYRGDLAYQNGDVVPDTHAAIISREEAAQVDRLLRRNRQLPPRTASAPRSLAGLVCCGQCQAPTTVARVMAKGKKLGEEYVYLRPQGCPQDPKCKAWDYNQVLHQVIDRICQDLPQAVAGMSFAGLDQAKMGLDAAITEKTAILEQLPQLQAQGILDQETVTLRTYRLRTELANLHKRRSQLPPVNLQELSQTVMIPQFWLDLSESERRFFFREFLQKIELLPGDSGAWEPRLKFIF
jgi:DNA invertase Pin-like site-specific DNA recombinase/predicted metal-binding protein